MAPAALLSSVATPVQGCYTASSSTKKRQPKRLVSTGSVVIQWLSDAHMASASVKSSVPLCYLDFVSGGRRKSAFTSNASNPSSRPVFSAAVEGSIAVEQTSAESATVEMPVESTPVAQEGASPKTAPQQSTGKFKPRLPGQKSRREDATVPADALVQGAVFKGKVTTIQPFGAFVNFGAFTDGLVHISKLSSGYVANVTDIVSIGLEVSVTILSVDQTTGRIALSMVGAEEKESRQVESRDGGDRSRVQVGSDGKPVNRGRTAGGGRATKRDEPQKPPTKLVKGQTVEGTVKNKIRSGVFVELPDAEEGFLRFSDMPGGENMAPDASVQVGQKLQATVLKIDRGRIVLTMKPAVDMASVNRQINKGLNDVATNPFELAFRGLNLFPDGADEPMTTSVSVVDEIAVEDEDVKPEATSAVEEAPVSEEVVPEATAAIEEVPAEEAAATFGVIPGAKDSLSEVTAALKVIPSAEERDLSAVTVGVEDVPVAEDDGVATIPAAVESATSFEDLVAGPFANVEEAPPVEEEVNPMVGTAVEEAAVIENAIPGASPVVDEPRPVEEQEALILSEEITPKPTVKDEAKAGTTFGRLQGPVADDVILESNTVANEEVIPDSTTTVVEEAAFVPVILEEVVAIVDEATVTPAKEEVVSEPTVAPVAKQPASVSPALVKELRDETGAGMMDCKRALAESGGDVGIARDILRKKGLASADKKSSRIASEGLIGSYIHDSRIGVLVEVNCETDFVSRGETFKSLVDDMGMQVVASQQVQYVSVDDVPIEVVMKERELEAQREDLANKPESIRSKIVDGRVAKRLNDFALLEQPYIRDDKILVKDLVKQTVANLGENIKVRRFERYVLGEGLQKKSTDFAAEVAAQTAVKVTEAPKAEGIPANAVDTPSAEHAVVVSAALVKELRDQTGAGMMDCKKALIATENHLEKAVEFLRKKGLASAEKKATRLASEGLIGSYIHDGRIGILIEVNCETDFVARGEKFKELVEDLAMQVAAYSQVQVVSMEDVPDEVVAKEKELESGKEDLANKPEAIRLRVVEGRVAKRLSELALLEQPFIKDDKKLVRDVVKETVASLGENIQVRRFTRFNLGEGIEKKTVDFAAEIAAQTGVKV